MDKLTISFYGALASTTAALTLIVVKVDMWLAQRRRDKALFGRNQIVKRLLEHKQTD